MSNVVALPQVAIVAVPDREGAHAKTCSGELRLTAHDPASVPLPLVVPVTVPPSGGTTPGAAHAPATGVAVAVGVGTGVAPGATTVNAKSPCAPP